MKKKQRLLNILNLIRKYMISPITGVYKEYVVCLICGHKAKTLNQHIRFKHQLSAKEYKEEFDLCYSQPLESIELTERRRQKAYEFATYKENLVKGGEKTRFNKGFDGKQFRVCEQKRYKASQNVKNTKLNKKHNQE